MNSSVAGVIRAAAEAWLSWAKYKCPWSAGYTPGRVEPPCGCCRYPGSRSYTAKCLAVPVTVRGRFTPHFAVD